MTDTFLDTGVLIAVGRGQEEEATWALAILGAPERRFIASAFLRLEVLPKAICYARPAEAAVYERYFAMAQMIPVSIPLVDQAYVEACTFGLSALDALHIPSTFFGLSRQSMPLRHPRHGNA